MSVNWHCQCVADKQMRSKRSSAARLADTQLTLQLFPIYNELKNKTQGRMNLVIGTSIGLAAISYELVSLSPSASLKYADQVAWYSECA